MMAEGLFNYTIDSPNDILNPGQNKWKPQSFEDYRERKTSFIVWKTTI